MDHHVCVLFFSRRICVCVCSTISIKCAPLTQARAENGAASSLRPHRQHRIWYTVYAIKKHMCVKANACVRVCAHAGIKYTYLYNRTQLRAAVQMLFQENHITCVSLHTNVRTSTTSSGHIMDLAPDYCAGWEYVGGDLQNYKCEFRQLATVAIDSDLYHIDSVSRVCNQFRAICCLFKMTVVRVYGTLTMYLPCSDTDGSIHVHLHA